MQYIISTMETSSIIRTFNIIASLCLIIPSQVQVTLSFPTTNQPLPSPSGTMFGFQEEDLAYENHKVLRNFVGTLRQIHSLVFSEYKKSRFGNIDATCDGAVAVPGLPPHHNLGEDYDIAEVDLLTTHKKYVEVYIEVMKAVIDDELLYEKPDNFVLSRDPESESFSTIKNWFDRVHSAIAHQIVLEGYVNEGVVLYREDGNFAFLPQAETFRNIRVLCVLEDINRYLPRLHNDVSILKNTHIS